MVHSLSAASATCVSTVIGDGGFDDLVVFVSRCVEQRGMGVAYSEHLDFCC